MLVLLRRRPASSRRISACFDILRLWIVLDCIGNPERKQRIVRWDSVELEGLGRCRGVVPWLMNWTKSVLTLASYARIEKVMSSYCS